MNKKFKILTVVGTRPEVIKLSECIKKIDKFFKQILVNTNQNFEYELNKIFFKELKIRKPDYNFPGSASNPISKIADNLIRFENICKKEKPDACLVLGDTNSALTVYAAKRQKIPIFHIEAGNRCFDQRVPEEINRKIIDHIADINIVYSDIARSYLLQEGLKPNHIIKLGSPLNEIYLINQSKINGSKILNKLNLKKNNYFLVSFHREENVNNQEKLILFSKILMQLIEKFNYRIVVSTHYKLQDRLKKLKLKFSKKINFYKPFGFFDYCNLQKNSFLTLSDSGTLTEESSLLGFKSLNLRDCNERPEGDEESTSPLGYLNSNFLMNQINILKETSLGNIIKDYQVDNFSEKLIKLIIGYTEKINSDVWKK